MRLFSQSNPATHWSCGLREWCEMQTRPREHPSEGSRGLTWLMPAVLAITLAVAYLLAARLSLALLTKPDGVAVFWPPAGIAAGTLIAMGPRLRVPVGIGVAVAS